MSSLLRSYAQTDARVENFVTLVDTTYYIPAAGARLKAVMTAAEFAAAFPTTGTFTVPSVKLLRDMGKVVVLVDGQGRHLGVYRSFQQQAGVLSEGVPVAYPTATFYVQVWSADPNTSGVVTVARVG